MKLCDYRHKHNYGQTCRHTNKICTIMLKYKQKNAKSSWHTNKSMHMHADMQTKTCKIMLAYKQNHGHACWRKNKSMHNSEMFIKFNLI